MPVRSAPMPQSNRPSLSAATSSLVDHPKVRETLGWFSRNLASINEQQVQLTEIPAPPFQESQRAEAVKALLSSAGLDVHIDATGNVIGELKGTTEKQVVIVAAHLDTVFPVGTDVKV